MWKKFVLRFVAGHFVCFTFSSIRKLFNSMLFVFGMIHFALLVSLWHGQKSEQREIHFQIDNKLSQLLKYELHSESNYKISGMQ